MTFQPASIIARKRDGQRLATADIAAFVDGFTCGEVPDYQMAALAMAIYLRGMEPSETADLTERMLHSGTILEWPANSPPVVDKHSTGGVGDKVSLVLAPLLACCGLWVPMISGRGLGATGGTLDKLESIPGFRTNLTLDEIRQVTQHVGCVITGATPQIAPADKKLYALRDVTATVASIPLITASIMSKKLAEGLNALVLDVKWGSGAFMQTLEKAQELARWMVATGRRMHVETTALITDMNQPLGRMAGNAVEVNEAVETLSGRGPADLIEVTLALGAELLVTSRRAVNLAAGRAQLQQHMNSGTGLEKFRQMVAAQGGSLDSRRAVAPPRDFVAQRAGFVVRIDTQILGTAVIEMGGGRRVITDSIDHAVGLEMLVRLGDRVEKNQPVMRVFAHQTAADRVWPVLTSAIDISDQSCSLPVLIVDRITE